MTDLLFLAMIAITAINTYWNWRLYDKLQAREAELAAREMILKLMEHDNG